MLCLCFCSVYFLTLLWVFIKRQFSHFVWIFFTFRWKIQFFPSFFCRCCCFCNLMMLKVKLVVVEVSTYTYICIYSGCGCCSFVLLYMACLRQWSLLQEYVDMCKCCALLPLFPLGSFFLSIYLPPLEQVVWPKKKIRILYLILYFITAILGFSHASATAIWNKKNIKIFSLCSKPNQLVAVSGSEMANGLKKNEIGFSSSGIYI